MQQKIVVKESNTNFAAAMQCEAKQSKAKQNKANMLCFCN
jgi:hypothetical protein